jgi:hypothetical protein
MTCNEFIAAYLAELEQGFACFTQPNGRLQVVTPYLYPDHDNIEVFVREKGDGSLVVSDLGETLRKLDTLGMDVCSTPALMFLAERIANGLGVWIDNGVIRKDGAPAEAGEIAFAVISVCQGVGDLIYRTRGYTPTSFEDEVDRFLKDGGVQAERKREVRGVSETVYTVNFQISTRQPPTLIEAISPKSNAGVRGKVNATFRMWSDINTVDARTVGKISLLNDDVLQFKDPDVRVLGRVSSVYKWTERQTFLSAMQGESAGATSPH